MHGEVVTGQHLLVIEEQALSRLIEEHVSRAMSAAQKPQEWLTVSDAAEHLRLTENAVRALVQRREIPFTKAGGRLRFNARDLDEWLRGDGEA